MAFLRSTARELDSAPYTPSATQGVQSPPQVNPHPAGRYIPPTKFSSQQMDIIQCPAPITVGQAFAGTGKSTTGIGYVMHHPDKRVLVLCFGAANAQELAWKYPSVSNTVKVSTAHAIARQHLPAQMGARVATRWSAITLRSELPLVGGRGDMRTAAITANVLRDFFLSTDEKIDPYLHSKSARKENQASDEAIRQCCEYAERLWLAMNTDQVLSFMRLPSGMNNPISIPHDAYLKRFIMMGQPLGFDTIIFDEAQDANPIMLKLLNDQRKHGTKILMLGDRHQSIYAFRGAVNAMENLPPEARVHPLTQSYRFGPRTAEWANLILGELKGEKIRIEGLGKDEPWDKTRDTLTNLSRSNADLIRQAVARNGEGVHWIGGIERYRITVLNDAWALRCGQTDKIQDLYIKRNYASWDDFKEVAKYDHETKIIHDLIEQYVSETPRIVDALRENAVPDAEDAGLVLSTLHNSKGLEWDYVRLSDDFGSCPMEDAEEWLAGKSDKFPEQEINLLYVGVTRARKNIYPGRNILQWAKRSNIEARRQERVRSWADEAHLQSAPEEEGVKNEARKRRHPAAGPFVPVGTFRTRH